MTMSKSVTSTGQAVPTGPRVTLEVVHYVSGSDEGMIEFRSGGSAGDVLLTIHTPAGAHSCTVTLGGGIDFPDGIHCTLTDVGAVDLIYQ